MESPEKTNAVQGERPECDISKTTIIAALCQVAEEHRDETWMESFFANVQTASFACGDPQVFTGPDGFPYFILNTPEARKPFESFCIRNMKDDFLLESGFGVVINPGENSADWVFSYGDIVNLQLNSIFYSKPEAPVANTAAAKASDEILVAHPSETYLPKYTRDILRKFLQSQGVATPKLLMINRNVDGAMVQALVFNVYREDFPDDAQFDFRMQQISWFLPRHYALFIISKDSNLTSDLEVF